MHVKIATVSGCIRTGERIPNTDRRFGAALEYVVAYLLQAGQDPQPLLFTVEQLRDAVDRAKTNPEDCPPFEPEQVRIDRAVGIARKEERAQVVASMLADCRYVRRRALFIGYLGGASLALAAVTLGRLL
jgi:hypothetical protein